MAKNIKTVPVNKQNTSKSKNNSKAPAKKQASYQNKVPFVNCYEECGIIESTPGKFSVAYSIDIPDKDTLNSIDIIKDGLRSLMVSLYPDFSCQIYIQNSTIPIDSFLDKVHIKENRSEKVNRYISAYNAMLDNNADIGHNNYERTLSFVLSTEAEIIDEAIAKFKNADARIVSCFKNVYGYTAKMQPIGERLETMYELFHPDSVSNYHSAKEGKTVKGAVAPSKYVTTNLDYLLIDNLFSRTLFINSLPSIVSHSLLGDLMSTSSNSIISIICEPIDTTLAQEIASDKAKSNIEKKKEYIRDTVEDRKNKKVQIKEIRKKEGESEYFYEQAEKVLNAAVENKDVMMMTTLLITLFAKSKEELDRDSKLLKLSASKFAVQVRPCEGFQDKAYQSVFPICNSKINTSRFLTSDTISSLQPLTTKKVVEDNSIFYGVNAISDNFVLINRNTCKTGLISGIPHSGKTFAVKRDIMSRVMNSDDEVVVLTRNTEPYKKVCDVCGGKMFEPSCINPFVYSSPKIQTQFMDAFILYSIGLPKKRMMASDKKMKIQAINKEAKELSKYSTWKEAIPNINANKQAFTYFLSVLFNGYKPVAHCSYYDDDTQLKIVRIENDGDLVVALAAVSTFVKKRAAEKKKVHVYVEDIDCLFYTTAGSDYLISVLNDFKTLPGTITCVVQDAVHILAEVDPTIEFNYFLEKIEFFKLLTQGPIEKRAYADKLNIPSSLVQYLSDREPGEGILITPMENVAFNDRFEKKNNDFYSLFY